METGETEDGSNEDEEEGVKDLGKLKSAYSIAGFIWFYCEKRYENRPDSIGYDTWLEHEIIGGQKD